jgi:hypothetical protein
LNCGSVMLLTEGMIIPIRARGAGKVLSTCRRTTVVTAAMVVPSAVTGDWRATRAAANMGAEDIAPLIKAKLAPAQEFLA